MKKYIFLLLFINNFILNGQSEYNGSGNLDHSSSNSVFPATPNAASLGKYGDYPVSLSTGVPNIEIPLFEVGTKRIKVPLSISYHASGIKIDEIASSVGLGWSLNAGGCIAVSVKGRPDHKDNGFSSNFIANDVRYLSTKEARDRMYSVHVAQQYIISDGTKRDSESDIYSYNFNGYSGQFYYNHKGEIIQLVKDGLKIEHILDGYKITTPDGIEYTFDTVEETQLGQWDNSQEHSSTLDWRADYISAYYLSSIKDLMSGEEILFRYDKYEIAYEPNYSLSENKTKYTVFYPSYEGLQGITSNPVNGVVSVYPTPPSKKPGYTHSTTYKMRAVSGITFPGGEVKIINTTDCEDMRVFRVSDIKLYSSEDKSTPVKTVKFNHSYFISDYGNSYRSYRLRLDGLTINDDQNYSFGYNSEKLPSYFNHEKWSDYFNSTDRNCLSQDEWGYYNGAINKTLYKYYPFECSDYKPPITGGDNDDPKPPVGGDPSVIKDWLFALMGFGKATVISITGTDGPTTDDPNINDNTNPTVPTMRSRRSDGNFCEADRTPNEKYMKACCLEKIIYPMGGETHFDFEANGSNGNIGGLRIKSITNYANGKESATKTTSYSYLNGKISPIYSNNTNWHYTQTYAYNTAESPDCYERYINRGYYGTSPVVSNRYNNGTIIYYENVTETVSDANDSVEHNIYTYCVDEGDAIYLPGRDYPSYAGAPYTSYMRTRNYSSGHLLKHEQQIYNKDKQKFVAQREIVNDYGVFGLQFDTIGSVMSVDLIHVDLGCYLLPSNCSEARCPEYQFFDIISESGIKKIIKTTTTDFFADGSKRVVITRYGYDSSGTHYFVNRETTTNSDGKEVVTETTYPSNYSNNSSGNSIYKTMLTGNMLNFPVERTTKVGGKITQGSITEYSQSGSIISPFKTYNLDINSPVADNNYSKLRFVNGTHILDSRYRAIGEYRYYPNGKLKEIIQPKSNDTTIILWSYNFQYPVAEIRNATISSVEQAVNNVFGKLLDNLSLETVPDETKLNNGALQSALPNATVSTYTYKPLVGVTSKTDAHGETISYEYDNAGRLERIIDKDGKTVGENTYNLRMSPQASDRSHNYISSRTYLEHDIDMTAGGEEYHGGTQYNRKGITMSRFVDKIQYFDGLGNLIEVVEQKASPNQKDIVSYIENDAYGQPSKQWLPLPTDQNTGSFVSLNNFQALPKIIYNNDQAPYSKIIRERSKQNRIIEQYGAGKAWHDNNKSVKTEYRTNASNECGRYKVDNSSNSFTSNNKYLIRNGNYPANTLMVTKTTDEDGKEFYEYKDNLGRTLMTRQKDGNENYDTYYVYDDLNRKRFVIPPKASDMLNSTSATTYNPETNSTIKELCYVYRYDTRGNCIYKKIPGAEPVYYIYDKADNLIFSQDGELRAKGRWAFSIPDKYGRVCLTGTCSHNYNYQNSSIKNVIMRAIPSTYGSSSGHTGGIAINPIPLVNTDEELGPSIHTGYYVTGGVIWTFRKYLSINYYDNYNFYANNNIMVPAGDNLSYNHEAQYGTYEVNAKTLLTGTVTAVLDDYDTPSGYLYSVMYYDGKKRSVQTKSTNAMGGYEKEYVSYNFTGQPTKKKHIHSAEREAGNNISVVNVTTEEYNYTYDHASRLKKTTHKLNDGTTVTLSENTYDEVGRLINTKLNSNDNLNQEYGYNVRSWLTKITNSRTSEEIYYNTTPSNESVMTTGGSSNNNLCWNGNISATRYKNISNGRSLSDETVRDNTLGLNYTYDGLNRLISATDVKTISGNVGQNNYSSSYTYDKNGNITLQILNEGSFVNREANSYVYHYLGNQLSMVQDNSISSFELIETALDGGRINRRDLLEQLSSAAEQVVSDGKAKPETSESVQQFFYDNNGNFKRDVLKGVEYGYNVLNMPLQISVNNSEVIGTINYKYDAAGNKLQTNYSWRNVTSVVAADEYDDLGDIAIDRGGLRDRASGGLAETGSGKNKIFQNSTQKIEYAGNKRYKDGALDMLHIDGGYIRDGNYYFYEKDHLGNNIAVIDVEGKLIQRTFYHPYGKPIEVLSFSSETQPFKYGGKEEETMLGLAQLDFHARQYYGNSDYMPPVFGQIDPLAEKRYGISPYVYCSDNPTNRVDPDGRDDYFNNQGEFLRRVNNGDDYIMIQNGNTFTQIPKVWLSNSAIKNIGEHYKSQISGTQNIDIKAVAMGDSEKKTLMMVKKNNPSTIEINVINPSTKWFVVNGGYVYKDLNTVANFINSLIHEKTHVEQYLSGEEMSKQDQELEAIATQKAHSTYEGTTGDYKGIIDRYESSNQIGDRASFQERADKKAEDFHNKCKNR